LTQSIVVDLVRVGLLTAECYPDQTGDGPWLFNKQNLDKYYTKMTMRVHIGTGYSTLPKAARALSVVGLKVADILNLIVQQELFCWATTNTPALACLSFDFEPIAALLEEPGSGRGLFGCEKAADRLGVKFLSLLNWMSAGLFSPKLYYACLPFFDPDDIDDFLAAYISSQAAAELLDVDVVELEELHDEKWGLAAVRGIRVDGQALCLFRREDVERTMIIGIK